jgi:hypothetical protein
MIIKIAADPTKATTPTNAANAPTENAFVGRNSIVNPHSIKGRMGAKNHKYPNVRSVDIKPANRPDKSCIGWFWAFLNKSLRSAADPTSVHPVHG